VRQQTPNPNLCCVLGLGFLFVAEVALIFIAPRNLHGVASGLQVTSEWRIAANAGAILEQRAAILRSIVIVLSQPRGWMRAGRRLVGVIFYAEPTISAASGFALLKSCEPAIPSLYNAHQG
jgi:hypothetical protein